MSPKTNPLGPGTTNLVANMKTEDKRALGRIAHAQGISLGALVREQMQQVIREATEKGILALLFASIIQGVFDLDLRRDGHRRTKRRDEIILVEEAA